MDRRTLSRSPKYQHRRWRVDFEIYYEDNKLTKWSALTRTFFGAYISAVWHVYFVSAGGDAYIVDTREEKGNA